jgi:hypothetical protein
MSNLNEKPVVESIRKPLWQRALIMLGGGTVSALFALTFFPSTFEQAAQLVARPISSAMASDSEKFISPAESRAQKLSAAKTAAHGMFVKDPYGCTYMFQYVSARLSLTPVLDEHKQPVCEK